MLRLNHLTGFGSGGDFFPVVKGTATSETSNSVTQVVSLPSGIVSGDLLRIELALRDGAVVTDWDVTKDFTEILQETNTGDITLAIGYRIADGTEGATVTVTIDVAQDGSHLSYRISDHSGNAPDGTGFEDTGTNPDPPDHTPAGGLKKYLWLASVAGKNQVTTADPTNYTDGFGIGSDPSIRSARRELHAISENPGVFTGVSVQYAAATVAIEPSA